MTDTWEAFPTAAPDPWAAFPSADSLTAEGAVKTAGTGLLKGGVMAASMMGDLRELIANAAKGVAPGSSKYIDAASRAAAHLTGGSTAENLKSIEDTFGELHKPQNKTEKYIETGAEFVPAALATGGRSVAQAGLNAVRYGVLPGVASEAAGQATEGSAWEPVARAGAAVATGGLSALLSRPATATNAIRSQLPEYITDAHINQAENLLNVAGHHGVTLTWPEALSQVTGRPVLRDLQRIIESSGETRTRMQEFMADRPQQVDAAARNTFDTVAPRVSNPSDIGQAAATAAESTLGDVRGTINAASEPYYRASSNVRLTPPEMARVRALPGYEEAADAVRRDPQLARYVQGLPDDSVGFLNEVKKYLDQASTNAAAPVNAQQNMQRSAGYGQDAAAVRQAGVNASQDYETALHLQTTGREQFLQPLLDGPLGKIAAAPETKRAINALFPENPLPNSAGEVRTAVSNIAQRNQWAATQLVRAHAEMVFNEAAQNLQSGPNQFGGSKFAAKIAGNTQQRANLQAAVEALPNGRATWAGFNNFLNVVEATGKRDAVGSKTSFNTADRKALEGGGIVTEAAKVGLSPGKWFTVIKDKWDSWQLGHNLDSLATIITSPQSGDLFRQIARLPAGSRQAEVVAARLILQGDVAAQDSRSRAPR